MNISHITEAEYPVFYSTYIKAVPGINLLEGLLEGKNRFLELIRPVSSEKLHETYALGKWTLAEVVLHCIDTERIFQYRLLRIARNDKSDLPGFSQDDYVPYSDADKRIKESLLHEYTIVRDSTIQLISNISDENLKHIGTIDGNLMSARALGFIICGHQYHHEMIIKDRYLK